MFALCQPLPFQATSAYGLLYSHDGMCIYIRLQMYKKYYKWQNKISKFILSIHRCAGNFWSIPRFAECRRQLVGAACRLHATCGVFECLLHVCGFLAYVQGPKVTKG